MQAQAPQESKKAVSQESQVSAVQLFTCAGSICIAYGSAGTEQEVWARLGLLGALQISYCLGGWEICWSIVKVWVGRAAFFASFFFCLDSPLSMYE